MKSAWPVVVLVIVFCGLAFLAGWMWRQQGDQAISFTPPASNPAGHVDHPRLASVASLAVAGDDRSAEDDRYRADLRNRQS
jgi:hypothetical protein